MSQDLFLEHHSSIVAVLRRTYFRGKFGELPTCVSYEDIEQMGMMCVLDKLDTWNADKGQFNSWAISTAIFGVYDWLRTFRGRGKNIRHAEWSLNYHVETEGEGDAHHEIIDLLPDDSLETEAEIVQRLTISTGELTRLICDHNGLDARERFVLVQAYMHGVKYADLAEIVGVSESRVSQLLRKGREVITGDDEIRELVA